MAKPIKALATKPEGLRTGGGENQLLEVVPTSDTNRHKNDHF